MRKKLPIWSFVTGIILALLLGATIWAFFNQQLITDFWRGKDYQPVGEMRRIQNDLKLTDRGTFLFKASRPRLSSRDEFNQHCRQVLDTEMAVLGCYKDDDIFIYDIQSTELDGIRELTTAHELLHAVWARMSTDQRTALSSVLDKVLTQNHDTLQNEIDNYTPEQRQEELFVRAGTEIASLPAELEQVYGEIFTDQDIIAAFYHKYITVFRAIEAEMDAIKAEMTTLQTQIDLSTADYQSKLSSLNSAIQSFNRCAETAGCFTTETEFYTKRNSLMAERTTLEALYDEINSLVGRYNALVEQYNADVTRTDQLNKTINSASEIEGL